MFKSSHTYHHEEGKKRKLPVKTIAISFLAVVMVIFVSWWTFFRAAPAGEDLSSQGNGQDDNTAILDASELSAKYMFSGTVVLARAVENDAKVAGGYDYSQPFSKIDTFNPKQYDTWTVDWECPTSSKHSLSFEYQVTNTVFNCRPEWIPEFSKYFTHANLANNHTADLGVDEFYETRDHLEKGGIYVIGNYDPAESSDACEVMSMPVHIKMNDGSKKDAKLPIAMCAWHYFERAPMDGEIEIMKEYSDIMPVFGLMQVGVEYVAHNDPRQEEVGHAIIDNGAEFVIGNSPHWVQNTEVYKGKPIIYSTGNFIFDQLESETNRGVSIEVNMTVDYDENVAKWLELGKQCQARGDDCLQKAKEMGLSKIQPKFTYIPIASTTGAHQITQKASSSVQKEVEQRMNWQQTLSELGQ